MAACMVGCRYAALDIRRLRRSGVSPIALFALGLAITGLSDTLGLLSLANDPSSPYNVYADRNHLLLASAIALIGWTSVLIGMRITTGRRVLRPAVLPLPPIRGAVSDRALLIGGTGIALLAIGAKFVDDPPQLGTVYSLFLLSPNLVAFALARAAFSRRMRGAALAALAIALFASVRALLFAYLRSDALSPLFAFALGAWLGSRSLAPFRSVYFLPVYLAVAAFLIYFRAFGDVRASQATSLARIAAIFERQEQLRHDGDDAAPALVRRMTSFNQLSQIGRVVEEDGFLGGATLQYLSYAFVPRFLWPGKPKIAKASWFAVRIGQGYQRPDGTYTNAVDMTVPGELYLNFGWAGVVLGSAAFGMLIGILWAKAEFWKDPRNTAGTAFGFYLLWISLGRGADLQVLVTLTAMYLLFVGLGGAVQLIRGNQTKRGRRLRLSTTPSPLNTPTGR